MYQLRRLLKAPSEAVNRKVFYLADYEPLSLRDWADEFQRRMSAPPIRRIPVWAARVAALAGDCLNRLGARRYPLNSFRLSNVMTSFEVDTSSLEVVCGPLPYTTQLGAAETVGWLNNMWSGGSEMPVP